MTGSERSGVSNIPSLLPRLCHANARRTYRFREDKVVDSRGGACTDARVASCPIFGISTRSCCLSLPVSLWRHGGLRVLGDTVDVVKRQTEAGSPSV